MSLQPVAQVNEFRNIPVKVAFCDRYRQELGAFIAKLHLRNYSGPIHAIEVRVRSMEIELKVITRVMDVQTSKIAMLEMTSKVPIHYVESSRTQTPEKFIADFVMERLRYVVNHELEECLLSGKEFVVNPHPEVADYKVT